MGETAPTAETTHPTDERTRRSRPSSDAASPVDPAEIRYRPGVRREGAFTVQYVTIHGYRRAYVKAGSGPALLLIHGIGDSSDTWRPVVEQLAEHYTVIAPDLLGPRALGEATGRLLGGGLRQRHARPPERAGGRPGHRRRAFAGRRRGGAVRLPVPRSLRAAGPGGQRGSGPDGQPAAARGRRAGHRSAHAVSRPAAVRSPAAWAPSCCASSTPRSGATPRRSWPCSTRCPTRGPHGHSAHAPLERRLERPGHHHGGPGLSGRGRPDADRVGAARRHHPAGPRPPDPHGDAGERARDLRRGRALPSPHRPGALRPRPARVHGALHAGPLRPERVAGTPPARQPGSRRTSPRRRRAPELSDATALRGAIEPGQRGLSTK